LSGGRPDGEAVNDSRAKNSEVPLVEIRNASIFRGNTRVFDNFSLTIAQHQPVAILGPNGSGKTTLLKVINREIYPVRDPDSVVRILGRDRWNVWQLRSRIGIVSHDLQAVYRPATTGLEVVLSGYLSSIGIHGLLANRILPGQRERALTTLEEIGAADLAGIRLGEMSTGQQRRCLLGRALVHDPDTLILDEPTAGLDLAAAFDYLGRIRRLSEAGKNIVLVSHSLSEIPPEIDRVILLRGGRIVADGSKHEVLTAENLRLTYGVDVRIAVIDGYYLAYPTGVAE
jgi:iron complex transport system ATP-binding protein